MIVLVHLAKMALFVLILITTFNVSVHQIGRFVIRSSSYFRFTLPLINVFFFVFLGANMWHRCRRVFRFPWNRAGLPKWGYMCQYARFLPVHLSNWMVWCPLHPKDRRLQQRHKRTDLRAWYLFKSAWSGKGLYLPMRTGIHQILSLFYSFLCSLFHFILKGMDYWWY